MRARNKAGATALVIAVAASTALAAQPADARAGRALPSRVITQKLDGPFGLAKLGRHGFVVAENVSGQLTAVSPSGSQRALFGKAPGLSGAAARGGKAYGVTGGPNEDGAPTGGRFGPSRVIAKNLRTGHVSVLANLLAYELKHNPDGQVQFVKGKPVDALSNPFSMTATKGGILVADGGANDVLKVNPRTGRVSTFFVPPTVKDVPACKGPDANSNPGTKGCDPVPTGVVQANGSVWVSTLGAERPGAGRLYKLNPRNGHVRRVWKGLTSPTGIAVGRDGAIYFSQVLFGAPEGDGPPPPGFDPSKVGRIVRIKDGHFTAAQVTMPTGLLITDGTLYASAWSIASFLGINHAGQVVQVERSLFK